MQVGSGQHTATPASAHWELCSWGRSGKECLGAGYLAWLAFVCSGQVLGRGDGGEAKLIFLFEKLTTSKLRILICEMA